MANEFVRGFTINIAKSSKQVNRKKESNTFTRISKRCEALVILDGDALKARITLSPVEETGNTEYLMLPFTERSFNLKGKNAVFLKQRDKYNHRVCILRDSNVANISPGLPEQYDALQEGLKVVGHIVKQNGLHYFDYEEIAAYSTKIIDVNDINALNKLLNE